MSDPESKGIDIISDAISFLPAPVKTSFIKAIGNFIGSLAAIPGAKFKQYAQGIEDTTAMRSAVAAIVAKSAADEALKDPVILQAATEIYLPTTLRKVRNRLQIAQKAAECVGDIADNSNESAPPNDDWMNTFMRFAEDASSDQLQELFGRILAGQVVRPGSFSLATLRVVSELDQTIADDFSRVWSRSVGTAIDYDPDFYRGEEFERWKRLVEVGLMSPSQAAQFLPQFTPVVNGNGLWCPMNTGDTHLLIHFPEHCTARWSHIDFTRVGCQIGSIIARPNYEDNMRKAGLKLATQGVTRVELYAAGKPVEVIFDTNSGLSAKN